MSKDGKWWRCSVKSREYGRRWSEANRERKAENFRRWSEANRERRREYHRRYNAERPVLSMFGTAVRMPDTTFAELSRQLRDERKAALKAAA